MFFQHVGSRRPATWEAVFLESQVFGELTGLLYTDQLTQLALTCRR
jgi:hypothetical protein